MSCPQCWWLHSVKQPDDTRPYVPMSCYSCGAMPPGWLGCKECEGEGVLEPIYLGDDPTHCAACGGLGAFKLKAAA